MSRNQVLSKRAIEGMIADGRSLVIYEGQVLQLDSWMDKHPGGRLVLQHMVGNDATSEMKA
jgi:delta8-fatty-acid desaturase